MIKNIIYDSYYKKGDALLESLLATATYCFSINDVQKKMGLASNNIVKILTRLEKKNKIIKLSRGLYAYFPPEEKKFGFNTIKILDPMMAHLGISYYVALLSAANHYGAAHYKPQILQVMIPKKITFRNAKKLGISFHVKKKFLKEAREKTKTPFGYIFYSKPEQLVLDLIEYEKASGGIENVALVIHDILPLIKNKNLEKTALACATMSIVQRLGFILEKLGEHKTLVNTLLRVIKKRGSSVIGLSSVLPVKGKFEAKWKIIQNTSWEIADDI